MPRWYCASNGQQQGPFDEGQVREMVRSGRLTGDDPVWSEGMADWVPLQTFPQLLPVAQPAAGRSRSRAGPAGPAGRRPGGSPMPRRRRPQWNRRRSRPRNSTPARS